MGIRIKAESNHLNTRNNTFSTKKILKEKMKIFNFIALIISAINCQIEDYRQIAKRGYIAEEPEFEKRMFPLERILNKAYDTGVPAKRMFPLERILNKANAANRQQRGY